MRRRLGWVAGIAGIAGLLLFLLNETLPIEHLSRLFQIWQASAWERKLRLYSSLLYEHRNSPKAWQAYPEVLYIRYDRRGEVRYWNTTRWPFPPTPGLETPAPELVSDGRVLYYGLKLLSDSLVQVVFLPIRVEGGESGPYVRWELPTAGDREWVRALCVSQEGGGSPLVLSDLSGRPLLRLYLRCPQGLRLPGRWIYLVLLGVAGVAAMGYVWLYWKDRLPLFQARLRMLGLLVAVWQVLHWTGLPERFLPGQHLSAETCAFSPLHTGIMDLLWTGAILLWAAALLPRRTSLPTWGYVGGFWGLWMGFWGAFYLIVRHSQLNFDIAQNWSLLSFVGWAIVVAFLWRVLRFLWASWTPQGHPLLLVGAGVALAVLLYARFAIWAVFALLFLYFSPFLGRYLIKPVFQIVQAVFLALTLNGFIVWGYERKAVALMEAYAPRVLQVRDGLLEYKLSQACARIAADRALWNSLIVQDYLIDAAFVAQLIRKHLLFVGGKYDVYISCWGRAENRLDNLFEWRPPPWQQIEKQSQMVAPFVYFVTRGEPRYYYVARVPIELEGFPFLWVRIDLHPRQQSLFARVEPQDEELPLSYGLYEKGRLVRQWGAEPFPLYVDVYRIGVQWRETSHSYEYLVPGDRGLLAYFRYPLRDRAAYFATLPLLLALLGIGLLLERASELWQMLKSLFLREGPLARQLQSLFWILVILSFFGIMVVSMFIFFQLSQQSIKKELHQRLLTVTAYLSGDPVLTEKLRYGLSSYIPVEESFVRDLMRRVAFLSGTEVFLYTQGGYLYSSTLPRAYWDKYGIPFLDPAVLEGMQNASAGPLIQEAPGGKRLIGYAPLRGGDGSLAGIVQVPMPLSQKAFYDPLRYFIGYVVNVYLLLMGGAILVGLLLIQRFSGGLERVVAQLRAVSGAPSPPLLHWEGKEDEIATLVEAYNDMVKKLQASQRQLEATLRRVSQQEIAFQAAHEIKTALTPLKIHLQHLQRMPTVDPDKLQEMATRLLQRIDALVRIANAFMSFARLGSAEPPQLTLIELGRFLEEQLHPFLQGPIPLELRLPESPLWIQGNADYLHQVLNNLLQNALQALEGHPAPHIWVTLTREGNEAILSLQDNGPGIPPEVQERIFEFYFTTRRTGTGLGLAITKGLVERMGGRISFTSEVGRGTVFYVAFPLASA